MRFRNLARWNADADLDGLTFFAQRLDEMLFDYTLDSYKPSALNTPQLVKEALALVSDIEAGVIDFANLSHVLEELVWSVQNDRVAKSLLDAEIEYYTAITNEGELASLKLRLEVLDRTVNAPRYSKAVIATLKEKIAAGEKQAIDTLSRTLVTTLINRGISKQHLYNAVLDSFFHDGPEITSLSAASEFFEKVEPKLHQFDVLLIASKNIKEVSASIKAFRLTMPDDLGDEARTIAFDRSFQPTPDEVYVQASGIEAQDPFSARQRAIHNLDGLSDLLALFQHRSRITWRLEAIVTQRCCNKTVRWITAPRGPMEKAADLRPEKAAKELNTLLKSFSAKGLSFRKFNRVADIHGICINHNIVDNQLVNLWTALETLTPSHSGSSKIANITSATLPFLLHAYVGRLVQQFTYDLTTWDKWRAKKLLHKVPCDPKTPLAGKALRLLCLGENRGLRDQLFESLKDFHLLRYRAFRLSETLSDKTKLQQLLATHEKKVAWQIRRIYRTRNLIVHSGRVPPPYIDTLVENGHDYLDTIVFEVMRISCGPYSATSLEQVFEIAKIRYQDFARKLTQNVPLTSENCDFLLGQQRSVVADEA
ncbi:hypothetical protein [Diaphorobacter sp.]|uniref:hypothetical protein n=1 Tax=Diaphorobacter sp. TaxID=1934310 RepID=UPI002589FC5E|nr:hypothetical protein [Diaphorobacter sp.]